MAEQQTELEGMPDPATKVYVSGTVGSPDGFTDGITKSKIGDERTLTARVEILNVGDQKQRQGRAHYVKFAVTELISLD